MSFPQISPGELSIAHQNLEGIENCTKCHNIGKGLSNYKCLDCHKEIKQRIEQSRGYHSSSEVKNKNCWFCHSEHHGRSFKIINFDEKKFDHSKTGFKLTGKHINISCQSCHQSKFFVSKSATKQKTFLGLSSECKNCHSDIHSNTAGDQCSSCHNTQSFNDNIIFDHSKTRFELIGKHNTTKCINCHKKDNGDNTSKIIFSKRQKVQCIDCHKDVHQGKFGSNCLQCHNYNSFSNADRTNFDHSKTNFALVGQHKKLNCNACHKGSVVIKINHSKCSNCHSDFHKAQFKNYTDCKECHNEFGFRPSIFSIESHNKSKFALTGSHLAIDCQKCHYKSESWNFRFENTRCINCHQNIHEDEISKQFFGENECSLCHDTKSWVSVSFNHDLTNFTLLGKHKEISCGSCHIKKSNNKIENVFKSIESNCTSCHNDYHNKQFSSNQCSKCHSFDKWEIKEFNHQLTSFNLEGAHKNLSCQKCHPKVISSNGSNYILYKIGKTKCIDCH